MSEPLAQFKRGVETGDLEAMMGALAPDAFLRSPVANGLRFEGRHELRQLFEATTDLYEDIEYMHDLGHEGTWVLSFRARIGKQRFQETLVLGLDEQGRVEELTASIRPLAGVATVAAAVGGRLARAHGWMRVLSFTALIAPLVRMTRAGEAIGPRMVKPARNSG